jgi:hypothetical protein
MAPGRAPGPQRRASPPTLRSAAMRPGVRGRRTSASSSARTPRAEEGPVRSAATPTEIARGERRRWTRGSLRSSPRPSRRPRARTRRSRVATVVVAFVSSSTSVGRASGAVEARARAASCARARAAALAPPRAAPSRALCASRRQQAGDVARAACTALSPAATWSSASSTMCGGARPRVVQRALEARGRC